MQDTRLNIGEKAYSHSTGLNPNAGLWSLRWCHFYGPSMPAIYAKYCERGGLPVIRKHIGVRLCVQQRVYNPAGGNPVK